MNTEKIPKFLVNPVSKSYTRKVIRYLKSKKIYDRDRVFNIYSEIKSEVIQNWDIANNSKFLEHLISKIGTKYINDTPIYKDYEKIYERKKHNKHLGKKRLSRIEDRLKKKNLEIAEKKLKQQEEKNNVWRKELNIVNGSFEMGKRR